ncbi:luciferin 4-monooxygenase-like [Hyposmocoma kahamanoa]|uniref:luciferin 4-monooxygenase-like n=1 Tax=Hyposmocoma kahamanoa TaxID=1477025 RepID=UPI000E6D5E33|nr:luciferin 4-monooxygenase-like [Hyposmocoma kahamanoa]
MQRRRANDSVHWFMNELSARVVAESGIPSDRYHLGKLILQSFKDAPDFITQIDGGTGESETCQSVLQRSIKCATAFKNVGLQHGDVVVLMGLSHIDLAIPLYAALYLGIAIAPIDRTYTVNELYESFNVIRPKMVFCQSEKAPDVQLAVKQLDQTIEIITFDKGDYFCNFSEFLEKNGDDTTIEDFRATDFDPDETISFLMSTSGTTGASKSAIASHMNLAISSPNLWLINTKKHILKPTFTTMVPPFMTTLIKPEDRDKCDFTCFELLILSGNAVPVELVKELKTISPNTEVAEIFGMTEMAGISFCYEDSPPGSCGKPLGCFQYRLIDMETGKDINVPNQRGELWVKGPGVFKGYYHNPKATEDAFAKDRWFKTGDIFFRDEHWNFYFVERIKLMLKYMIYHISPVELENLIRSHPGVLDAAVTGIPDPENGDLAVACVVRQSGSGVTAQDIKDLVKESLPEYKQLRGGVIFINELPMTASSKIHRVKLKQMVLHMERE